MHTATAKAKVDKPERAITWREARGEAKRRGIVVGVVGILRVVVLATGKGYVSGIAESSPAAVAELLRKVGGVS